MLVNSRKLSESIVSSDGCRLLDRAGANGRLSLISPFGRDGRAGASEGKGVGLGEGEESLRAVGACGCYNPSPQPSTLIQGGRRGVAGGVGSHAVPTEPGLILAQTL